MSEKDEEIQKLLMELNKKPTELNTKSLKVIENLYAENKILNDEIKRVYKEISESWSSE